MPYYKHVIDRTERILAKSNLVVKFCVLLRNRLVRIIAYSLVRDHTFEKSGELLLITKVGNLLKSVIDVGANKGEWSEMILNHSSLNLTSLTLVEPGKTAFSIITKKFGPDKRFTLLNIGLSDSEELLFYDEGSDASETSTFSINPSSHISNNYVPVKKLDSILKETNCETIDFLKIDCEGFDFKVIQGSLDHIKLQAFGLIQFEYNTMWVKAGSTLKATFDLLIACNYEVYLLNHKGLIPYNVDYYQEFFGYSNFVAVAPNWKKNVEDIIYKEKA